MQQLMEIVSMLLLIIPIILTIAYYTLMERHLIASIQRRQGPNVTGVFGLLQPLADGVKLILKETLLPSQINLIPYLISPIIVFVFCFSQWSQIPFKYMKGTVIIETNYSILLFLALGSIASIGIFLAGWSSNSKYAFLGALRAIAQVISYELALSTLLLCLSLFLTTFSFGAFIYIQKAILPLLVPLLFYSILCFIFILAETNRAPFDLPEGESEIVAGFNLEYSSFLFALFFLGEYAKMLATSAIFTTLFITTSMAAHTHALTLLLILCIAYLFIFVRAILPRYRVDQLMHIGWSVYLPLVFALYFCYLTGSVL
jgi:NADH-quinone oxidoreductase subunit H